MLTSAPTKHGSGITLYGDAHDLRALRETITKVADERHVEERFGNFMLGLAYDLRKAYEGARESKRVGVPGLDSVKYFSVNVLWPYFLPQVALIRHFAAYHPTSHRDQGWLYFFGGLRDNFTPCARCKYRQGVFGMVFDVSDASSRLPD